MTGRRYSILLIVMLAASCGDTCLSVGMKRVGPVSLTHLGSLFTAMTTPWIDAAILLLPSFVATNLTALTWADLTFVLPATSFGYVIVALLSRFALHEHVSVSRWIGVLLITSAVGFVTRGPSYTETGPTPAAKQTSLQQEMEQV